ncbi:hypothetical protein Tco_0772520 [Tanacetum coccineum]|uniref:Uncharacterized protein n=1 Tax=Tanacetum coccineum TaxID=301880 RepID=A0ABQ4ZI39_9ASTR
MHKDRRSQRRVTTYGKVDPSTFMVDPLPAKTAVYLTKWTCFVHLVNASFLSNPRPPLLLGEYMRAKIEQCGLEETVGTDNANITRKRSKPDKHEHKNGKSAQEPGDPMIGIKGRDEIKSQESMYSDLEASSSPINRDRSSLTEISFKCKYGARHGLGVKARSKGWSLSLRYGHSQSMLAQREQELLAQKQAAQEKEQLLVQEQQEVKNIVEPEAKRQTRITPCLKNFRIIIPSNKTSQISSVNAITHDLPTEEPEDSLIMGNEHLSTIPEMEKSSVEDLVPTPSESEDFFDNESECDMPVNDESSPIFTTFSNPLFDSNDNFTSSNDESLSNEDVPMGNFKIYSNPLFEDEEIISTKIDPHSFNEFSDPIPPGIKKADFDLEEEIRLAENLSYDNSSPRPPEELNVEIADTIVESLSPPLIPVEDSDSHMEEIYLFLASDDLMPPGIEDYDYDSEGDIRFLEELLSNNSSPLPENESSHFNLYDDPSYPRPPPKPPDVEICLNFEPNTTVKNDFDELNEDDSFDPGGGEIDVFANVEDDDSFTFVIRIFLPYLADSPLLLSCGSEDTIFDPGIPT